MVSLVVEENLIIRNFEINDADNVWQCVKENTAHLQTWISWINPLSNLAQIQDFIHQQLQAIEHQEGLMLGIFFEQKLIGMLGLQNWHHELKMAELGFWLSVNHIKKGIMTRCIKEVLDFGFQSMQLQRVTATFAIANTSAHKLLERLGFKLEGVLRKHILHKGLKSDMVYMGLLKEEYLSK